MARLVFLDDDVRDLYVDWWARARDVVAFLRPDIARPPGPPVAQTLIEELSALSPEFRQIWAEHDIKAREHGSYRYRHPSAGELVLHYETLRLPEHPDLALIVHTAEKGSAAQEHYAARPATPDTALVPRRAVRHGGASPELSPRCSPPARRSPSVPAVPL